MQITGGFSLCMPPANVKFACMCPQFSRQPHATFTETTMIFLQVQVQKFSNKLDLRIQ
jgi:hypothetical protein